MILATDRTSSLSNWRSFGMGSVSVPTTRAGGARLYQVGDQLGGDRLPAGRLSVLACVPVVRADRGDVLRRGPLGRVDHDQLLHQGVVDRPAVGLDDEHVGAPDRAVIASAELPV